MVKRGFFSDVIEAPEGAFGLLDGTIRIDKGSNSLEKKALYLPFVAPILRVREESWAPSWQKTLEQFGLLNASPVDYLPATNF